MVWLTAVVDAVVRVCHHHLYAIEIDVIVPLLSFTIPQQVLHRMNEEMRKREHIGFWLLASSFLLLYRFFNFSRDLSL